MPPLRSLTVCLVSDSHLSPRAPFAEANWEAVLAHIDRTSPDLVVHCGDIALDGPGHPEDLVFARRLLDRLPVPWLAVPGNHDVGDPDGRWATDEVKRKEYEAVFGDRYWSHELAGWRLVGVDIQELLAGGADKWQRWLQTELATGRQTVLVQHRPLFPTGGTVDEPRRFVTEPMRGEILAMLANVDTDVRAVVSGHVHQRQVVNSSDIDHIWVPTTWATMPDGKQPLIGEKLPGVASVELGSDGAVSTSFDEVEGLTPAVVGQTFPTPYGPASDTGRP